MHIDANRHDLVLVSRMATTRRPICPIRCCDRTDDRRLPRTARAAVRRCTRADRRAWRQFRKWCSYYGAGYRWNGTRLRY